MVGFQEMVMKLMRRRGGLLQDLRCRGRLSVVVEMKESRSSANSCTSINLSKAR